MSDYGFLFSSPPQKLGVAHGRLVCFVPSQLLRLSSTAYLGHYQYTGLLKVVNLHKCFLKLFKTVSVTLISLQKVWTYDQETPHDLKQMKSIFIDMTADLYWI